MPHLAETDILMIFCYFISQKGSFKCYSQSLTEPPKRDPLSKASFHVKVRQSCRNRSKICVQVPLCFNEPESYVLLSYLVFREGKLGLNSTQLIIVSEKRKKNRIKTWSALIVLWRIMLPVLLNIAIDKVKGRRRATD